MFLLLYTTHSTYSIPVLDDRSNLCFYCYISIIQRESKGLEKISYKTFMHVSIVIYQSFNFNLEKLINRLVHCFYCYIPIIQRIINQYKVIKKKYVSIVIFQSFNTQISMHTLEQTNGFYCYISIIQHIEIDFDSKLTCFYVSIVIFQSFDRGDFSAVSRLEYYTPGFINFTSSRG